MVDYVSRLPQDIRGELIQVLRGRELVEYCKEYKCKIDWRARLYRDFAISDNEATMADYMAYVVAEELGLPSERRSYATVLQVRAYAERGVPQAIDYYILHADIADAGDIFYIRSAKTYNYIWDHHPYLREYLTLAALAFCPRCIRPPREYPIPSSTVAQWMKTLCNNKDEPVELFSGLARGIKDYRESLGL